MKYAVRLQMACLGLALVACQHSSEPNSKLKMTSGQKAMNVISTNPACVGNPPKGASIEGTWTGTPIDGSFTALEMKISKGEVDEVLTCSETHAVAVSAQSSYDDKKLTVLGPVEDPGAREDAEPSNKFSDASADPAHPCAYELKPQVLNYKLVGNCIEFTDKAGTHDLVREEVQN